MEQTIELEQQTPERLRQYDDVSTWLSEVLKGRMQTTFEYTFDGKELYSHEGLPITPVFEDAISDAEKAAQSDSFLEFEVRRRKIERTELEDIFAMARGNAPDTMVVVSDFVPELMDAREDVGGYNVSRKQTMLRIISRTPDGTIKMVSQSLEGSHRTALEAIYAHLGFVPDDGELLGQRMQFDMTPEEQEFLTDELMGVYDRVLETKYGGSWFAGWHLPSERARINTYDFVLNQSDLIDAFLGKDLPGFDESALYGLAAAMRERYENLVNGAEHFIAPAIGDPMQEMALAARFARETGLVFSGCGLSLGTMGEDSIERELGDTGYGNKIDEDEYGPLNFKCQKGHSNMRPRGELIDSCKTCGVSVRC